MYYIVYIYEYRGNRTLNFELGSIWNGTYTTLLCLRAFVPNAIWRVQYSLTVPEKVTSFADSVPPFHLNLSSVQGRRYFFGQSFCGFCFEI